MTSPCARRLQPGAVTASLVPHCYPAPFHMSCAPALHSGKGASGFKIFVLAITSSICTLLLSMHVCRVLQVMCAVAHAAQQLMPCDGGGSCVGPAASGASTGSPFCVAVRVEAPAAERFAELLRQQLARIAPGKVRCGGGWFHARASFSFQTACCGGAVVWGVQASMVGRGPHGQLARTMPGKMCA